MTCLDAFYSFDIAYWNHKSVSGQRGYGFKSRFCLSGLPHSDTPKRVSSKLNCYSPTSSSKRVNKYNSGKDEGSQIKEKKMKNLRQ